MVIPGLILVVDDRRTETASRVDASSGDGDGGQVDQEHCKSNGQWCQNLFLQSKQKINQ